jgi:O-acetyl-ADP-ribose deacetylase (regulator of RNase III)
MNGSNSNASRIKLAVGNIALLDVDAVVNAANTSLVLGGGVAGAIRRYGGESIQAECDRLAPVKVGQAVLTGAGRLKARYVIHAVGPVNGEGDEDAKLGRATLSSLVLARERKIGRLAFPAISTGIFGFPLRRCSEIMIRTTLDFLAQSDWPREVIFCLFEREACAVFEETLGALSG